LEYLPPNDLSSRPFTLWKLGFASFLKGDRSRARQAYTEVISISQAYGNLIVSKRATIGLGNIEEAGNQLYLAAETYRRVLKLVGDLP
jgi:LuxR family maltose regulon positive regulatory protein